MDHLLMVSYYVVSEAELNKLGWIQSLDLKFVYLNDKHSGSNITPSVLTFNLSLGFWRHKHSCILELSSE